VQNIKGNYQTFLKKNSGNNSLRLKAKYITGNYRKIVKMK